MRLGHAGAGCHGHRELAEVGRDRDGDAHGRQAWDRRLHDDVRRRVGTAGGVVRVGDVHGGLEVDLAEAAAVRGRRGVVRRGADVDAREACKVAVIGNTNL